MKRRGTIELALVGVLLAMVGSTVRGDVTSFVDKDEWIAAVGSFTTIGFSDFPPNTFITDQYVDLGVLFTDGADITRFCPDTCPVDEWGLDGNDFIQLEFSASMAYIAVDYAGDVQIDMYSDGVLIGSAMFGAGGIGNFGGLISTELFDSAILFDPVLKDVFLDDLHFGPQVCPGDVDGDGIVGITDFLDLLFAWGPNPGHPADLDGDDVVGIIDFLDLIANWGPCS